MLRNTVNLASISADVKRSRPAYELFIDSWGKKSRFDGVSTLDTTLENWAAKKSHSSSSYLMESLGVHIRTINAFKSFDARTSRLPIADRVLKAVELAHPGYFLPSSDLVHLVLSSIRSSVAEEQELLRQTLRDRQADPDSEESINWISGSEDELQAIVKEIILEGSIGLFASLGRSLQNSDLPCPYPLSIRGSFNISIRRLLCEKIQSSLYDTAEIQRKLFQELLVVAKMSTLHGDWGRLECTDGDDICINFNYSTEV